MRRVLLAGLVGLAVLLAGCSEPPPPQASGEEIYLQVCARCHSEDLSGGIGPALGPGSAAAGRSDDYYRTTILRGRGSMPAFSSTLTDRQVDRVIAYLRSRQ